MYKIIYRLRLNCLSREAATLKYKIIFRKTWLLREPGKGRQNTNWMAIMRNNEVRFDLF